MISSGRYEELENGHEMRVNSSPSLASQDFGRSAVAIDIERGVFPSSSLNRRKNQRQRIIHPRMRRMKKLLDSLLKSMRTSTFWFVTAIIFLMLSIVFLSNGAFNKNVNSGLISEMVARKWYPLPFVENLVMVAGHSVYVDKNCGSSKEEKSWYLEPYQKLKGQAATFVDHIEVGVRETSRDPKSLLLFSGGETRQEVGPRTEAQSYWTVAEQASWFGIG